MARMVEFCNDRNMHFLLVCMPDAYKSDEINRLLSIDPAFDKRFFEKDLKQFADSLQIDFLSLQEPFEQAAADGDDLRWVHWNYAGHRLVADELSDYILSRIPPKP